MGSNRLGFQDLVDLGWKIDERKGMSNRRLTSISFCLMDRRNHPRGCVQGFGRTRSEAITDAVAEANQWIERERLMTR